MGYPSGLPGAGPSPRPGCPQRTRAYLIIFDIWFRNQKHENASKVPPKNTTFFGFWLGKNTDLFSAADGGRKILATIFDIYQKNTIKIGFWSENPHEIPEIGPKKKQVS